MRTRQVLCTLLVVMPLLGTALFAGAAHATTVPPGGDAPIGGIGLRLMEAPVEARDDPRALVYIIDRLAPGTTITRRIEVSNTTLAPLQVELYAAAVTITDGTFLGAAGATANELSGWTSVNPRFPMVASGVPVTASVTIAVPTDAAPGERYGVVWAEARSTGAWGVTQVSRVGIRLYVSVGEGAAPAADFTIDTLTAARSATGQPMVTAMVHNTGGRALDMRGTLQLSNGPGGLGAGPFPADLGKTLGLDDTQPVSVMLDGDFPNGPWLVSVTLTSGLTSREVHATLEFPNAGVGEPVDAETSSDGPPWVLIGGGGAGLLLLLLGGGSFLVRRRRA